MSHHIQKIIIVGGGSAGWMTAAYLSKALDKKAQIILVESSNITTIGVGEASFSTIKVFFDFLDLQEKEWMPKCNATYKMAIKFVNWNAQRRNFYHPFQRYKVINRFEISEWWLKMKRFEEPFDYACFPVPWLCDNQRSPKYLDGKVFDDQVQDLFSHEQIIENKVLADLKVQYPYAYHFDTNLLAKLLKDYATLRGVEQIIDDVVDVKLKDDGSIDCVITNKHSHLHGDLFIDCTGFRGLLINKALNEPFISFSESLLCDSAMTMQIPTDIEKNGINPYTTATALNSGWVWNIPLYGRIGTGYVYSSAFISSEQAEREFRMHLGEASNNSNVSYIKMRIGRNRNSWVKNCVAIGLSSGFVEPLESTGIFFIQYGIEELVSHLPNKLFNEDIIRSYNKNIANCIDGVRDFLILHYYATDRTDTPFWKASKNEIVVTEEMLDRLRLWKNKLPNSRSINSNYHGFESYSYSVMLLGLNYIPEASLPILDYSDNQDAIATFSAIKKRATYLCTTLPSQYEYLTHLKERDI